MHPRYVVIFKFGNGEIADVTIMNDMSELKGLVENSGYDLFSMEATEENCKRFNVWPEFSNIEAVKEVIR